MAYAKYKLTAKHLEPDELLYELGIRGFEGKSDVSVMRKELSRLLRLESLGRAISYPDYDCKFEDEVTAIEGKMVVLKNLIEEFTLQSDTKDFRALDSRLSHVMGRCDRLAAGNKEQKIVRSKLISNVIGLGENLQTILKSRREGGLKESVSFIGSDPEEDPIPGPSGTATSTPQRATVPLHTITEFLPSRKSVPVYKWDLKFSGEKKGMSVNAFLERVAELKISRAVADDELFHSASDLFTCSALNWFRGIRSSVNSWDELKRELILQFQICDYDFHLLDEIRHTTQGRDEKIGSFLPRINILFSRLTNPLPSSERLKYILHNIHPFYQDKLALVDVDSESKLLELGRRIEEMEARKKHYNPPDRNRTLIEPDLAYVSCSADTGNNNNFRSGRKHRRNNNTRNIVTPDNSHSSSGENASVAVVRCWNCAGEGHISRGCKVPPVVHCRKCGKIGVLTAACNCQSGNE